MVVRLDFEVMRI